ncbi:MAG: TIGR03118 family protein [Pseudomonadota bacterium]
MNTNLKRFALALSLCGGLLACGGGGYGGGSMTTATPTPAVPLPASVYLATSLVADNGATAGYANEAMRTIDPLLVNPWGLAFNPAGFAWLANNGSNSSTLYDGNGVAQSLVVRLPDGSSPTGIVFNGSTDFMVSQGGLSGPGSFIFAGEAGTLAAWSPAVDRTHAFLVVDNGAGGAIYKGLAMASFGGANYLYASDFHNRRIDVFDSAFRRVLLAGSFTDPNLPAGYAPFGIQAIGGKLYVSYALQDSAGEDDLHGPGLGLVDRFDSGGNFEARLVTGGALNAPWGMALAPAGFGAFSGMLLVGNFGDGRINAYDPASGAPMGSLARADGQGIVIDGLWAIAFGNGINSQPATTLFFTAGPGDEAHGAYGRIDAQ